MADSSTKSSPTYVQTAKEVGPVVTLAEYKAFSNNNSTLNDDLLKMYIDAAVNISEKYMHRDILTTTYQSYRPDFFSDPFLRRAKYQSVESIEYLVDGAYIVLLATEYTIKTGGLYAEICSVSAPSHDCSCNAVRVTFKTGFGDDASSVPSDIKIAIMQIAVFIDFNKGDCSDEGSIPSSAAAFLKNYKNARIC